MKFANILLFKGDSVILPEGPHSTRLGPLSYCMVPDLVCTNSTMTTLKVYSINIVR